MRIYVAKYNSDQTEGRGPMVIKGYFEDEQDAYESIRGMGVMGYGDGEVYAIDVTPKGKLINPNTETPIYGYHRFGNGWRRGWVDGRDLPEINPAVEAAERAELKRLLDKYGKG